MSTINKDIWLDLLRNDGCYEDDPIPVSLWTYIDQGGKRAYKVCYSHPEANAFVTSPYVTEAKMAWNQEGLTEYGVRLAESVS